MEKDLKKNMYIYKTYKNESLSVVSTPETQLYLEN